MLNDLHFCVNSQLRKPGQGRPMFTQAETGPRLAHMWLFFCLFLYFAFLFRAICVINEGGCIIGGNRRLAKWMEKEDPRLQSQGIKLVCGQMIVSSINL